MKNRNAHQQLIKLKQQKEEVPNTLLFEMDGVILDSVPVLWKIYLSLLEKRFVKGSKKEFNQILGLPICDYVEYLIEKYGFHSSRSQLQEEYLILLNKIERFPFLKFSQLIQESYKQGFTIGVISSQIKKQTKIYLEELTPFLDGIFSSDLISNNPSISPNLFKHALSVFGTDPEDALAIVYSQQAFSAANEAGTYIHSVSKNKSISV